MSSKKALHFLVQEGGNILSGPLILQMGYEQTLPCFSKEKPVATAHGAYYYVAVMAGSAQQLVGLWKMEAKYPLVTMML